MLLRAWGHPISGHAVVLWMLLQCCYLAGCSSIPRSWGQQQLVPKHHVHTAADEHQSRNLIVAPTVSNRLVYRIDDIVKYWNDSEVTCFEIEDTVHLDEAAWRADFAATGGVAKLGPAGNSRRNLTLTSDCLLPAGDVQRSSWQLLSFGNIPNAVSVEGGAVLTLRGLILADIALSAAYQYTPAQPWRNAGVGFPLWPSIVLEPNATLVLQDVGINYENPSEWDTCEQYNQKVLYGLQQQYGANNITAVNSTAGRFPRPVRISVLVYDGRSQGSTGTTADNRSSEARALFTNVVFNCIPPQTGGADTTGRVRVLVAAIVAPVGGLIVLAALLCCWWRRRQHQRSLSVKSPGSNSKDLELGHAVLHHTDPGAHTSRDHDDAQHRVLAVPLLQPMGGAGSILPSAAQTAAVSDRGSSARSGDSSGSPPGAATPEIQTGAIHANMHSSEELSGQYLSAESAHPAAHLQQSEVSGLVAAGPSSWLVHAPNKQDNTQVLASVQDATGRAVVGRPQVSSSSRSQQHAGHVNHLGFNAAPADTRSFPAAVAAGGTPHSTASTCNTAGSHGGLVGSVRRSGDGRAGSANTSGRCSAVGSAEGSASAVASGTTDGNLGSNSYSVAAGSSRMHRGADVQDRGSRDVPALLKARSDMVVLRDLKIGPLLGQGSYGRVYKGRWKSVTVAVKIIEHSETAASAPGSAARVMDVGRESLLATSIAHPNVVQTYHISTMTAAQRNALAATWLQEGASSNLAASQLVATAHPDLLDTDRSVDSSSSSSSSSILQAEQKDVLETWMLMEFCEKGSLERALGQGRFLTRDGGPEMIGIYKALLDTASGLDYLHSIGVVHGDLKTANVLLKGSTRDVRGFACKITDFGLSRVLDLDATHISTRTYGTITYMPAELLLTGRMTQATDIYSFGLMMWELYTSTRVFEEGLSIGQIFYMIAYQGWRPVIPEGCAPGYAALMQACWHQDAEQRPTAQQVLKALQKLYGAQKRTMAAAKQAAAGTPQNTAATAGAAYAAATTSASLQTAGPTLGRLNTDSAASSKCSLASVSEGSRQRWGYPAQSQLLQRPPAVIPVRHLGADTGGFGQFINESAAVGPLSASDEEIPTGQLFPGNYQGFVGVGSSESQEPGGGGGGTDTGSGRLSGSGGPDVRDEYQPWARAVSMQAALPAAGDSHFDRVRQSDRTPQHSHNWSLPPAAAAPSGVHWQEANGAGLPSYNQHPCAGSVGNLSLQQQQPVTWQQPHVCQPLPADRYLPTLQLLELDLDGQSAVDNEQIPTESLFQRVSSASNVCNTLSGSVLFSGNEEDGGQDDDVSGFLHMAPALQYSGLQPTAAALTQRAAERDHDLMAQAAAQDFVDALTMASSVGPGGGGGVTGQLLSTSQYPATGQPSHNSMFCETPGAAGPAATAATVLNVTAEAGARAYSPYAYDSSLSYQHGSITQLPGNSLSMGSSTGLSGPVVAAGAQNGVHYQGPALTSTPQEGQQQAASSAPPDPHSIKTITPAPAGAVPMTATGLPPPATKASWPSTGTSPFAQHPLASRPAAPPVLASSALRRSSTPERSSTPPRPLFVYRTPSGRVYTPSPTTGVPQTVREGSGTTTATSASGAESLRVGSVGSGNVSLHPAGSTAYTPAAAPMSVQLGAQQMEQGSKSRTGLQGAQSSLQS